MLSDNPIYNRSQTFAKEVIKAVKLIRQDAITKPLINQLVRSATSVGANISEATFAASKKDFINKITVALKEAHESEYWLDIIASGEYLSAENTLSLQQDIRSIIKILSTIRQNAAAKAAAKTT